MANIFKIILIVFLTSIFSCSQNKTDIEIEQRINDYLAELEKIGFSSSILVELKGKKIISKGFGYSDKNKNIHNSPFTIFDIGSITKQFTAAAILKLEMQGKLSTDAHISEFFENVPYDKKNITIHDLLRHQSGLISNIGRDYEEIDEIDFFNKVLSSPLLFEVGTSFSYSNIGYSLLAKIVEKVSGLSYETYLYENLWKPAEMEMTGYTRPKFDTNNIAIGYTRLDSAWGKPIDKEWDKNAPYWHLNGNG